MVVVGAITNKKTLGNRGRGGHWGGGGGRGGGWGGGGGGGGGDGGWYLGVFVLAVWVVGGVLEGWIITLGSVGEKGGIESE